MTPTNCPIRPFVLLSFTIILILVAGCILTIQNESKLPFVWPKAPSDEIIKSEIMEYISKCEWEIKFTDQPISDLYSSSEVKIDSVLVTDKFFLGKVGSVKFTLNGHIKSTENLQWKNFTYNGKCTFNYNEASKKWTIEEKSKRLIVRFTQN